MVVLFSAAVLKKPTGIITSSPLLRFECVINRILTEDNIQRVISAWFFRRTPDAERDRAQQTSSTTARRFTAMRYSYLCLIDCIGGGCNIARGCVSFVNLVPNVAR
ncbi:hypothetical protein PUN28_018841 [Cardiocondyla obscurior]|uniref:Secreted protein n=1 Tax=Cardiocondyla obscurior TaxID=286306 RepID=A0AAW2EC99_9HYME